MEEHYATNHDIERERLTPDLLEEVRVLVRIYGYFFNHWPEYGLYANVGLTCVQIIEKPKRGYAWYYVQPVDQDDTSRQAKGSFKSELISLAERTKRLLAELGLEKADNLTLAGIFD